MSVKCPLAVEKLMVVSWLPNSGPVSDGSYMTSSTRVVLRRSYGKGSSSPRNRQRHPDTATLPYESTPSSRNIARAQPPRVPLTNSTLIAHGSNIGAVSVYLAETVGGMERWESQETKKMHGRSLSLCILKKGAGIMAVSRSALRRS